MMFITAGLALLKGLSFAKAASPLLGLASNLSPVLKFIKLYWREVLIGVLILCMLLLKQCKDSTIGDLKNDLVTCGSNLALVENVNVQNGLAIDQCVQINIDNAQDLYDAELNARLAEERARTAEAESNKQVEIINEEVQQFRDDTDCRTLSDPLPDAFDSWLRDGAEVHYTVPDR